MLNLEKVKLPTVGIMILPGTLVLELLRVMADLRTHVVDGRTNSIGDKNEDGQRRNFCSGERQERLLGAR